MEKKSKKTNRLSMIAYIVSIVVLASLSGFLGYKYYQLQKDPVTSTEYKEVIASVRKLMTIDQDEQIRVAVVQNPEELVKENPIFYKDVKKGYFILFLPDSQKVIIYDKKENKIVNFSTLRLKTDIIPDSKIPEREKPLNIELRYTSDVTKDAIDKVKTQFEGISTNYKVTSITQTKNKYSGANIILLNKARKPNLSQNIVALVIANTVTEVLPANEETSKADVLIIIGKNN